LTEGYSNMCGIAGFFTLEEFEDARKAVVHRMCDSMLMRGPDAVDYWSDPNSGMTLGHRRLSIIDLDSRANQPMREDDGRHVIVFNGEIYNFQELRLTLEGKGETFTTHSDTEVLLKLYRHEGESMLSKLRGMFAFAIWDRQTRSIFVARDPYGIKPLYLASCKQGWLFASQVKALLASGCVDRASDPVGQMGFWLLGSVPEPRTWFRDISALPAGTWCRLAHDGTRTGPHRYWDIADAWREAPQCGFSRAEAQEVVREAVIKSLQRHLVADVPVGVFLSGGIDSGSLAGLMKDCGAASIQGVTIAFDEFKGKHEDEVPVASAIARSYGIRHSVRRITREEFEADLPKIMASMDQPSIDGINTWFASKAAAELGLKVVISGVGGDELFYGYPSFRQLPALVSGWNMLSGIPGARPLVDLALSQAARRSGNARWRWLTRQAGSLYGAYWLRRGLYTPDDLPSLMGAELAYEALQEADPASLLKLMAGRLSTDQMAAVGQIESTAYLRNQLLRDSDWASMAHGVELRTPLVDAWLLQDLMPVLRSFGRLNGKALLAASPAIPLSDEIIHRVKTGFGVPLGIWKQESMTASASAARSTATQGGNDSRQWAQAVASAIYKT
jgi:asparagine synthase (glutamine-hydrolysing)